MVYDFLKKKNNGRTMSFIICLSFVVFYYGLKSKISYQPDVYTGIMTNLSGDNNSISTVQTLVRPLAVFLGYLISKLHLAYSGKYFVNMTENYICALLAFYRFSRCLIKEVEEEYHTILDSKSVCWLSVLSCVILGNLFSCEALLYPGLHYYLSILLIVEAVISFITFLDNNSKRYFVKSIIFVFLSSNIYQIIPSMFVILTIPIVLYRYKLIIEYIKKIILIGLSYAIAMLPQIVMVKMVFNSPKQSNDVKYSSFIQAAEHYAPSGVSYSDFIIQRIPYGLWIYMVLCILLAIVLIMIAIKKREYCELYKGFFLAASIIIMGLLPYIFKLGGDFKPRVYYPLASLFGVLMMYGVLKRFSDISIFHVPSIFIFKSLLIFFLVVQWRSFLDIYTTQYITDYEDMYISEMIGNCISEYEKNSGNTIKYISYYEDAHKTKYIDNKGWCLSKRAYCEEWSRLPVLNFYLNQKYQNGEINEELSIWYAKQDWSVFSENQISFIGDTAHICVY